MKQKLLIGVVALMSFIGAMESKAQLMYLTPVTSNYTISPGDSFTLALNLINNSVTLGGIGYSYALKSNVSGVFTVMSRQLYVLDDFTSGNGTTNYSITTSGTADLGATWNTVDFVSTGTTLIQTVNIAAAADVTPGSYTLSLFLASAGPGVDDADFNSYMMSTPLQISVNVVPEASVYWSVLMGVGMIFYRRYRFC